MTFDAGRQFLAALCGPVLVLAFAGTNGALAQTPVTDFSSGPSNGAYVFASQTPKTFGDLTRPAASRNADPANPVGHLFLPPGTAKGPAVILIHGSGGVYDAMLDFWPKQFNAAGIAVFAVDSFGPRGVKATTDDQSQIPFAAETADAFAALRLLASHPRIDSERVAVMGFSRGGITAWRTAVERVASAQGGPRFAAHIPTYSGGCAGVFPLVVRPGVFAKAPMLWLHGDEDDYAPMAPCQAYAERIRQAGTPVEFVVIPGARHKFDADDTRRHFIRGAQKTLATCPIEMDVDTFAMSSRDTGQRLQGPALQEVLKTQCTALGATVEGNRNARDQAAKAVVGFLGRVFAR